MIINFRKMDGKPRRGVMAFRKIIHPFGIMNLKK